MARSINPKCLACSQLPVEAAKQLHGEAGDGCWNDRVCHRRRSHYLNRDDNNQKRRGQYTQKKAEVAILSRSCKPKSLVVTPEIPPTVPAIALIYLYREKRKDAHLHAVAISVWQGDQKLEQFQPTHCMGMTNMQVRQYLQGILQELNQRYGIREFEPEIYRDPSLCPIVPCPLKDQLEE
jgi:hypothetical protein